MKKVKEKINNLDLLIKDFIDETTDDAKQIKVLETPDLLRQHLLMKIHRVNNNEFSKLYKAQIQTILYNRVRTIFELAEIFEKIELLIEDDHIASLDFWRYKLYQVLMDGVKK